MADRIFPNTFKEEPLDSDLVFKGIDWDNFNTKLAEVKNGEQNNELPEEFREILAKKNEHLSTIRIYNFRRQLFVLKRLLKQTNEVLFKYK